MARLIIVGTGPGSPDYVTPAARKAVNESKVVIGSERSLNLFHGDIKGETMTLTGKNVDEAIKYANDSVTKGKTVALLSVGDPGFSGLSGSVLRRSLPKDVEMYVVPGISSIQACAARLCMSWDEATLFTFHDGVTREKQDDLLSAVKAGKDVMLLPEPKTFNAQGVSSFLINHGVDGKTPAAICENLTLDEEKIVETTLEKASTLSFSPMCVMVIKSSLTKKKS